MPKRTDLTAKRLEGEMQGMVADLNALFAAPAEVDGLIAVLRFLVAAHPELSAARIAKILETTARKGREEVTVDVLDELKRAGRVEGRVEGVARTLLGQLTARFGEVPADVRERIFASTEPKLRRWAIRVLTEPTLAAVLGSARVAGPAKKRAATSPRATRWRPTGITTPGAGGSSPAASRRRVR